MKGSIPKTILLPRVGNTLLDRKLSNQILLLQLSTGSKKRMLKLSVMKMIHYIILTSFIEVVKMGSIMSHLEINVTIIYGYQF